MYTSAQITSIDASVGIFGVGRNWTVNYLIRQQKTLLIELTRTNLTIYTRAQISNINVSIGIFSVNNY